MPRLRFLAEAEAVLARVFVKVSEGVDAPSSPLSDVPRSVIEETKISPSASLCHASKPCICGFLS
ncbi:hypothetical protein [Sphingobium olei]|uniref:Uncharacterized protein n=1 Tax=Sphingobium olei TaxID=420955 RepID=A0ABW3NWL5_9SPHN